LLEGAELNETSEQDAVLAEGGRRRLPSFATTGFRGRRFPMADGRFSRPRVFRRTKRWPVVFNQYTDDLSARSATPDMAWAQSCLAKVMGRWVRQTGRLDSVTKRAIRILQSRHRLVVTGFLDNQTLTALR